MAAYLAQRIIDGAYKYDYVATKRPDLMPGVDAYLVDNNRTDLITSGSA
ncbi:hypothetical protein [Paenibacillus sp. MMS18-CY102]|nr:hypothetical protein [Paenibacillus sp. MMS18-CY102]